MIDRVARWLPALAWATLVSNIVIVVTGGAVRLTDSGLGCPTWPDCKDGKLTPRASLTAHSAIEFGNRMLTFVLVVIAIATVVAAWRTTQRRLALVIFAGIPIQAVIGGISVRTHLNPWVVSIHLVASMAIISLAVLLVWRVHGRAALPSSLVSSGAVPAPALWLAWATYAVGWLVLYAGTVVTGAGPHAGDAHSKRNGLSTLQVSQLHADLVCLIVGLTIGLLIATYALRPVASARTAVWGLVGTEVVQAAIGWVQYFTHVPIGLVAVHMLGSALFTAALTWALLAIREPSPAPSSLPTTAPTAPRPAHTADIPG